MTSPAGVTISTFGDWGANAVEMLWELHQRRVSRQIETLERMCCQTCGHKGAYISPVESEF